MSLINEALKRTRDASLQSGGAVPPAVPAYQPSRDDDGMSTGTRVAMVGIIITLIAAVAAGSLYLINARHAAESTSTIEVIQPSTPQLPAPLPAPQTEPKAPEKTDANPNDDAVVARVLEKLKAEQPATPPAPVTLSPKPPKLLLQGITRDSKTREAMINGVNVREGEEIEGARVIAIEAHGVKLEFAGSEFVLRLP